MKSNLKKKYFFENPILRIYCGLVYFSVFHFKKISELVCYVKKLR